MTFSQRKPLFVKTLNVSHSWHAFLLLFTVLTTSSCAFDVTFGEEDKPLAHLVLVWLKEPGNPTHRAQLIAASKRLEQINGVVAVKVGQSIPSDRSVVDDSFDVGLYVEFESQEALSAYATDPLHLSIVKNDIVPVTERYIVYDFEVDRVVME